MAYSWIRCRCLSPQSSNHAMKAGSYRLPSSYMASCIAAMALANIKRQVARCRVAEFKQQCRRMRSFRAPIKVHTCNAWKLDKMAALASVTGTPMSMASP